jgi:hypothetical protein
MVRCVTGNTAFRVPMELLRSTGGGLPPPQAAINRVFYQRGFLRTLQAISRQLAAMLRRYCPGRSLKPERHHLQRVIGGGKACSQV